MLVKSKVIGIILSCIFCISAVTCGIVFGILKSQPQTTATTENVTTGLETNIFNTNGTINKTAANALLDAVGYYDYSASTTGYTAHNIAGRTSNNSGNSIIFKMGYANGTSGTDLVWQATYLYNNYLTIWLDKNYTTSVWTEEYPDTVAYENYKNSNIHSYLNNTFYPIVTQNSSVLKSIFATPSIAGYQTIVDDTVDSEEGYFMYIGGDGGEMMFSVYSYNENLSKSVGENSYMWLPSYGEVINNSSDSYSNSSTSFIGLWGLNSIDRNFATSLYTNTSTTSDAYWLRSESSNFGQPGAVSIYLNLLSGGIIILQKMVFALRVISR